jgi:hypothetical protein
LGESINENMRHGMTAEDAIRAARAEVGSAQAVKHKVWRAGWESRVDLLWKDFTYTPSPPLALARPRLYRRPLHRAGHCR